MLLLIIVLILLFGGGAGYYGHSRYGFGGGPELDWALSLPFC